MKTLSPSKAIIAYFCVLTCIFPLFFTDFYYNIQLSKSLFFILSTCLALICTVLFSHGQPDESLRSSVSFRKAPESLAVLLFCLCALISACLSPYGSYAFTGGAGRHMGFLLILSMCLCFFLFSRHPIDFSPYYRFLFVGCSLVSAIGILQYMRIDLLGLSGHVPAWLSGSYLSTIGQINTFSNYVSMCTAFCIGAGFLTSNKLLYIPTLLGYTALFAGNSDSGFLCILAVFLFLPLFIRKQQDLIRVIDQIFLFFLSGCVGYILFRNTLMPFQGLSYFLSRPVVFLPLLFLTALLAVFVRSPRGSKLPFSSFRNIYGPIFLGLIACAVLAVVLTNLRLISIPPLLFDDRWGSYRGYIWKKVWQVYQSAPPLRKLFGYGPDTLRLLLSESCQEEILSVTGKIYDSAHNDILQYLVTTGAAGALSWLLIWGTLILRLFKTNQPEALPWLLALIAYFLQTMLIPTQPITAPLAFMFAGIGSSLAKPASQKNPAEI